MTGTACFCHSFAQTMWNSELTHRGTLSDGARHNFIKRGVVVVPGQNVSTERALELAIEAGAEDVQEIEDEEEQPLLQVRHKGASYLKRVVQTSRIRDCVVVGRCKHILMSSEIYHPSPYHIIITHISAAYLADTVKPKVWSVSPQFICNMTDVRKVQASLEEQGMQVTSSGLEFAPRTLMPLDQDKLTAATMLIEALSDNPDVMRVWDNIQVDSWECFRDTLWTLNLSHMDLILVEEGFITRRPVLLMNNDVKISAF